MSMLEQMRARMKERQQTSYEKDYSIFPFWNLKFGGAATLRLLPYNDEFTGGFWTERINLPMAFTDNLDDTKVIKFNAPCLEMYGRNTGKCPVLAPVRDLYAEEKELRNSGQTADADKLKKIAGAHWKKFLYYYQGFVVKPGFVEEEVPENPIRVFPFNKKLHSLIYDSLLNEEDPFETLPVGEFTEEDVKLLVAGEEVDPSKFQGYNFICKKAQQGEYADWTTSSSWSKNASDLDDEQIAAINEYGFHDLSKRLPDRPSDEAYDVLVEMMEVSIQRLITGENGVWRKEWEEAGFKPFRQNAKGGNTSSDESTTSTARKSSAATNASKATGNAIDKLKASRGKKEEAPVVEPDADDTSPADVAETAEAAPAVEEQTETKSSTAQSLRDRIKARKAQSA